MNDKTQNIVEDEEERSISQVSKENKISKLVGIPLVAIAALVGLYIILGGNNDEDEETLLIDPVEESFKSAKTSDKLNLPAPKEPKVPETKLEETKNEEPKPRQLTELERQALADARRQHEEALRKAEARKRSPIIIVNKSIGEKATESVASAASIATRQTSTDSGRLLTADLTPDELLNSSTADQVAVVEASFIRNNAYMVTQGTVIPGVLETAIDSSLPGFIRAVTSEAVYSFDGTKLLVPAHSTLIGRYQSSVQRGQHRVFVIWTRILRPDGASIAINSPGTDQLGAAGIGGFVDNHFWEIFGNSILLSVISGGIQIAIEEARDSGDNSTTVIDNNSSLADTPSIALENSINISPTIHVDQGTKLNIFVAQDIDFSKTTL